MVGLFSKKAKLKAIPIVELTSIHSNPKESEETILEKKFFTSGSIPLIKEPY